MIIYRITHKASGHVYIGRTMGTAAKRWRRHVAEAIRTRREIPLWAAICRYGKEAFSVEAVRECASVEEMVRAEYEQIAFEKTMGRVLFNETLGGNGSLGLKHSVDARLKIQRNAINRYASGASHPRSRPCVIDGVEYASRAIAARRLGVDRRVVDRWAKTGIGRRRSVRSDRIHGWIPEHEVKSIAT